MAAEDFYYEDNPRNDALKIFDLIFTSIFVAEMLVKIISMGFLLDEGTYLRNSWNVLDFSTACISAVFVNHIDVRVCVRNHGRICYTSGSKMINPG